MHLSKIKLFGLVSVCSFSLLALGSVSAQAQVTFYTDEATFNAAAGSTTLIDFEGIVADTGISSRTPSKVIGGVTFSIADGEVEAIAGKNSALGPYNSALLISINATPITADLTSAGSNFTAVGGQFGCTTQTSPGTLTLNLASGSSIRESVTASYLGQGNTPNFFGFTVIGDTITSITLSTARPLPGIDNFVFGTGIPAQTPEPGSLAFLAGMSISGSAFVLRRCRNARKAA